MLFLSLKYPVPVPVPAASVPVLVPVLYACFRLSTTSPFDCRLFTLNYHLSFVIRF